MQASKSALASEDSALEFLSTCAAKVLTNWNVIHAGKASPKVTLAFQSGTITGTGQDTNGAYTWTGKLTASGNATITRSHKNGKVRGYQGRYEKAKNAIVGFFTGRGGDSEVGDFVFTLEVPEMTVQFARDDDDTSKKGAVNEYMAQRDKVMTAVLGKSNDDVLTTWNAIYVYGSGRSDTLKDLLLRFTGPKIAGGGTDVAGEYTWNGSVEGDTVTFSKDYVGAHSVVHQGTFNEKRDGIKGTWSIPGTRAVGNFQMNEDPTRRINAEAMSLAGPMEKLSVSGAPSEKGALTARVTCDTCWTVVYVYGSGRADEVKDLQLRFVNGSVTGSGEDNLGIYKWTGTLTPAGGVEITKAYAGQHSVHHSGQYDGSVIKGSWSVPNTRAVGGFRMEERVAQRRIVDKRYTDPLGSFADAVVITADIIYDLGGGKKDSATGVQLRVTDGQVFSKGVDGVGEFKWTGEIKQQGVSVLTKSYPGKHDVIHKGTYNNQSTLTGTWEIAGKASGAFTLEEVVAERRLASKGHGPGDLGASLTSQPIGAPAFPSVERAGLAATVTLPPLSLARAEIVSFWSGNQFVGATRTPIEEFSMTLDQGRFQGTGNDSGTGPFTIEGSLDKKLQVELIKTYTGSGMKVNFKGTYNPDVSSIQGQWDMTGMRARGDFDLIELTEKRIG